MLLSIAAWHAILHFSYAEGNLYIWSAFNPLLDSLWIESKHLMHHGSSDSASIICQVECNQHEGCEYAMSVCCKPATIMVFQYSLFL